MWDLASPYVPVYTFDVHDDVTRRFLWADADTVWSVSKDRCFVKYDIGVAFKPRELLSRSAVGWSVYGDLAFSVETGRGSVWCGSDDL